VESNSGHRHTGEILARRAWPLTVSILLRGIEGVQSQEMLTLCFCDLWKM